MDAIKEIWARGADLVKNKCHQDALLDFTRAKALLLLESKILYDSNGQNGDQRAKKLMGEIIVQLNTSIEKSVEVLQSNPVLCLGLKRGFTKTDVKKAYRKSALKYHPDKNQDCDSSCIFTAIQSAYEKLSESAPSAPGEGDNINSNNGGDQSKSKFGRRHPKPASNSSDQQAERNRAAQSAYGPPPPRSRQREKEKVPPGAGYYASQASGASKMSTDDLRRMLFEFGFVGLEGAGREELIKKYLAVQAHLTAGQRRAKGNAANARDKSQRERHTRQSEAAENWAKEMRREQDRLRQMQHERARRQEFKMNQEAAAEREAEREKDKNLSAADKRRKAYDLAYGPGSQPKTGPTNKKAPGKRGRARVSPRGAKGGVGAEEDRKGQREPVHEPTSEPETPGYVFTHGRGPSGEEGIAATGSTTSTSPNRSKDADTARKNRVERLAAELPLKSVSELRRMLDMSGVSYDQGLEKSAVLEKLYTHFGMVDHVRHQERMERARAAAEEEDLNDDYRERARSDFATLREGFDLKMDIEALRAAISGASGGQDTVSGESGSKVNMTREKLEALEKKMFGVKHATQAGKEKLRSPSGPQRRRQLPKAAPMAPTDQNPLNASWPEWMGVGLLSDDDDSDAERPDNPSHTRPEKETSEANVRTTATTHTSMAAKTRATHKRQEKPISSFKVPDFEYIGRKESSPDKDAEEDGHDDFDKGLMNRFKPFLFDDMPEPMPIPAPIPAHASEPASTPEAPAAAPIFPSSAETTSGTETFGVSVSASPSTNTPEGSDSGPIHSETPVNVTLPRGGLYTGDVDGDDDERGRGGTQDVNFLRSSSEIPSPREIRVSRSTATVNHSASPSNTNVNRPIGVVPVIGLSKVRIASLGLISDSDESDSSSDESIDPSDLGFRPAPLGKRFNSAPKAMHTKGPRTPTAWADGDAEGGGNSWFWGAEDME